jgi:hypothetical protein
VKIGSYVSLNIGYEKSNVFSNISKITCNITNLIRDKSKYTINEKQKRITVIDTASTCKSQFSIKKMSGNNNTANKRQNNMGIITVFPYKIYT